MSTCIKCRFYDKTASQCKRYPPLVVVRENDYQDVWPKVQPEDYCGEWKTKAVM